MASHRARYPLFDSANRVKVVLIGPSGSGKTSLLERITTEEPFSEKVEPTLAAFYAQKSYDDLNLKLCFWDLSGNEQYSEAAELCYRDIDLAVFVLDASQALEQQKEFLVKRKEQFQKVCPKAKCLLVITKAQEQAQEQDEQKLMNAEQIEAFRKKLCITSDVILTSAKENKTMAFEGLLCNEAKKIVLKKHQNAQQFNPEAEINELFEQAISSIDNKDSKLNQFILLILQEKNHLKCKHVMNAKNDFRKHLLRLQVKTLDEFRSKKWNLDEGKELANQVLTLSTKVADLSAGTNDLSAFNTATLKYQGSSLLGAIIGGLVGAALGVVIGVMIGAAAGPVAAFTGLAGGVKGAIIGASLGGAFFGMAGAWCSMWLMNRCHPVSGLKRAANEVIQRSSAERDEIASQKPIV